MKRVLAVAVAALLVAAAILVRDTLDDDGDGTDDGGSDDDRTVACVTELRTACEALGPAVRVEDPADTIAAGSQIDAWVTFDPWPAMAAVQQGQAVFFTDAPVGVAVSDLVLVARTAALPGSCAGAPTWTCVADATGSSRPALPRSGTAFGAVVLGHAAADWWGTVDFARQDLEDPGFQAWLRSLQFVRDPVADMLQLGNAGPVATGSTRATFETVVETSRDAAALDAASTAVPAAVAVVVVGPDADRVAADTRLLAGLQELGWQLDATAASTGLPRAGVLVALQEIT